MSALRDRLRIVVDLRRLPAAALLSVCLLSGCSLFLDRTPAVETVSAADEMVVYSMRNAKGQPSRVRRLRIVDQITNQPLLELEASDGEPRLAGLELRMGENPVMPAGVSDGAYAVILPRSQRNFRLEKDRDYLLQLWGGASDRSMISAPFHFATPMKMAPARSIYDAPGKNPAPPSDDAVEPPSDDAKLPPSNASRDNPRVKHRLE